MDATYLNLTYGQVALAALLIVVNGAASIALRLKLERSLLIASVRTVGQLLLVGLVLQWIFQADRWYLVVAMMIVMTLIAALTATGRNPRRYPGVWLNTIVSIWASSWLVTAYGVFVVLQNYAEWYHPQYLIPLLGMVLGNTLNGISLGLDTFTNSLVTRRDQVESLLTLGATRWEAARGPIQQAVRTGMIPVVNSMMVVGVVSLPGMMTGQLLSGTSPVEAVKYQIVIMFLIASATTLGTVSIMVLSYLRLFNRDHQFLYHRLAERPSESS